MDLKLHNQYGLTHMLRKRFLKITSDLMNRAAIKRQAADAFPRLRTTGYDQSPLGDDLLVFTIETVDTESQPFA